MFVRDEEVVLVEGGNGLVFVRGDGDTDGGGEGGALQGFDFGGHGGGEEIGVPAGGGVGKLFEDFVDDGAEVEVKQAVGFVHDEVFELLEAEAFGVFEVVEEASGGCDNDMGVLAEGDGLWDHVHAAD